LPSEKERKARWRLLAGSLKSPRQITLQVYLL